MRLRHPAPYQIIESTDVSHVAARRRRITAVVSPVDLIQSCEILTAMAKRYAKGVDVLFLFLWDDAANVGKTAARVRATFVRNGFEPTSPPKGEAIQVRDGVITVEASQ